jgi:hypothetical protein
MKNKFLILLCIFCITSAIVVAEETEIELSEWSVTQPRDGHTGSGNSRPCRKCFLASYSGSTLSVFNNTSQTARVVVTSLTSFNVVVSRDWVGTTTEQLPQDSYEIVIYTDEGALGGYFDVE